MSRAHSIGKPTCSDCGKPLSKRGYRRCRACASADREAVRLATLTARGLARLAEQLPLGAKVERWEVIGTPVFRAAREGGKRRWFVRCRCHCERKTEEDVLCQNLLEGESNSCGCLRTEACRKQATRHGGSYTRLYSLWKGMLGRCYQRGHTKYEYYGGRGITVCEAWRSDFAAFRAWALASGYREGLEIDRYPDNDGPYAPDNCRFVTKVQQQRNRTDNRVMAAFGTLKCLADWADDPRCQVSYGTLTSRLRYGWDLEAALSVPPLWAGGPARQRRPRKPR